MKIRYFKKDDDCVIYSCPAKKYQGGYFFNNTELTFSDCTFPKEVLGLPFIDIDLSEAILADPYKGIYVEQLYCDGEFKKENLKIDYNWDYYLMPSSLIKQKHIKRVQSQIDEELAKPTPDAVKLVTLQRNCEKCKEVKAGTQNKDVYWMNIAIANLDARVANGEPDKPVIREKLLAKIEQLKK